MNVRLIYPLFLALCFVFGAKAQAADTAKVSKPGYKVVVKISFDEKGVGQGATVVESDDPTNDSILHRVALTLASKVEQPPRTKDGKAIPFSALVPFDFPVEGDEGEIANKAPRPTPKNPGERPVYPPKLAAAGEIGGARLELVIGVDGKIKSVKVLESSHPEFAESAETAVKTWVFAPALKDGIPVESRWRTVIAYSTDGKDVDWKWRVAPRPSLGGNIVFPHTLANKPGAVSQDTPVPLSQPSLMAPTPAKPEEKAADK